MWKTLCRAMLKRAAVLPFEEKYRPLRNGPINLMGLRNLKKNRVDLACVSQKTRKLYGPEKPFLKLRPAYSLELVFSYVVEGIKLKITAKFRRRETPSF